MQTEQPDSLAGEVRVSWAVFVLLTDLEELFIQMRVSSLSVASCAIFSRPWVAALLSHGAL